MSANSVLSCSARILWYIGRNGSLLVMAASKESGRVERRLAAILAADVAGYSRLMGTDEIGTLQALKAHRKELIDPAITAHRGRIVKTTGDGMLVEFASVIDAVGCAVAVQRAMVSRNADVAESKRIVFRIGVNIGDIIIDGDDIFGDGVNVAARLETLCEPGGLCISRSANEQIRDKLSLAFADLGEQTMKNIARAVGVFGLAANDIAALPEEELPRARMGARSARGTGGRRSSAAGRSSRVIETERMAPPTKPSIAVLPFVNLSVDPGQEFFADGLAEDILTGLSRFRDLFVISRNSTFRYKGKAVDVRSVARELGVQFVLEGSVRRAGDTVRVTAQLIDANTDGHVWADRYDRRLEDIFAIQDDVTSSIIATLPGRVEAATRDRVKRKAPDNLAAYECVLAGKLLHHRSSKSDNAEALRLLERAIALDADYAHAHAWKACTLGQSYVYGWCADREATGQEVVEELRIALALDDNDSDVHRILAAVNLAAYHDHEKAFYHQERALGLNPNDDLIVVQQGEILTWLGRPEEGIEWIRKAMRLNPYHPERFWSHLARAYFAARRYEEAIKAFQRVNNADDAHFAALSACYAALGDDVAANASASEVLKRTPGFSVASHLTTQHYKQNSDLEHYRAALLKAGLPP
jgi:adenylate cyclase